MFALAYLTRFLFFNFVPHVSHAWLWCFGYQGAFTSFFLFLAHGSPSPSFCLLFYCWPSWFHETWNISWCNSTNLHGGWRAVVDRPPIPVHDEIDEVQETFWYVLFPLQPGFLLYRRYDCNSCIGCLATCLRFYNMARQKTGFALGSCRSNCTLSPCFSCWFLSVSFLGCAVLIIVSSSFLRYAQPCISIYCSRGAQAEVGCSWNSIFYLPASFQVSYTRLHMWVDDTVTLFRLHVFYSLYNGLVRRDCCTVC